MGGVFFLALSGALGLGLVAGRPFGAIAQVAIALVLGASGLGLAERHYGFWQELKPFWRRGGEYLIAMLVAALGAGLALSPATLPEFGPPWRFGLGLGACAALWLTELAAGKIRRFR